MSNSIFSEEFPSDFEAMAGALDRAIDALSRHQWIDAGREAPTRLCVEEALSNAIRHGNHGDRERKVRLEINGNGCECTIQVYDEGNGFSPGAIGLPKPDQMGGRGICLIRHFMDRVDYDNEAHCLAMSFRRQASGRGA